MNNILSVVNQTINENESIFIYNSKYMNKLHNLITNTMATDAGKK